AEGQRRYLESLSAYARQFLERMDRPEVDEIRGISPAMAIEQKNPVKTSRSTVGTATGIQDYLRLLFARIGQTICPDCQMPVHKDQVADVLAALSSLPEGTKVFIGIPINHADPQALTRQLLNLKEKGFFRFIVAGKIYEFDALSEIPEQSRFPIWGLIDRLKVAGTETSRMADSVEQAFREGHGQLVIQVVDGPVWHFSQHFVCNRCHRAFIEPEPRLFSFNNPFGACPECKGFGAVISIDLKRVIPDRRKSIRQGAIVPWNTEGNREWFNRLQESAGSQGIDLSWPFGELPERHQQYIVHGDQHFPGILGFFASLESKTYKIGVRVFFSRFRGYTTCPRCQGSRLQPAALYVYLQGQNIAAINTMSVNQADAFFQQWSLPAFEQEVAHTILKEIRSRLKYLVDVGLGYLSLARRTQTLSGGEMKRINLANALGSQLVGTLFVLDEPTIGLHPRDNHRLMNILTQLKAMGNTLIVVEHDREMMQLADYIIDLGPGAGLNGGMVIFQGTYAELLATENSITSQYLRYKKRITFPHIAVQKPLHFIKIVGATAHNLKNIDVVFPLGSLVLVTGVSGSGKSTLIEEILYPALKRELGDWEIKVGSHRQILGSYLIDDVILMDQSPIGRTPRSNPVTYLKVFDSIRQVFADTRMARLRGFKPGAFSFNVPGGRCEKCEGAGVIKVEMQFLADLYLICDACAGKRYQKKILDIYYKGKNIAEVLNFTVQAAMRFFREVPQIYNGLVQLDQVGLGYLQLGQPATTLSGGEAQRLKLADHLLIKKHQRRLYLFDEPSTGLHFDDITKLLHCFEQLIQAGNSVVIIEHNLDIIQCADYIIDLGPEGGAQGGEIVVQGPPEAIMRCPHSYTGQFLKAYLQKIRS
ncbi:excinuclease ABC subunit UvrA, partial [candidate division KSB1 bacterium]|nr:excinuclease ABC subunit UvrA [candidate division KSB1 bacterium]